MNTREKIFLALALAMVFMITRIGWKSILAVNEAPDYPSAKEKHFPSRGAVQVGSEYYEVKTDETGIHFLSRGLPPILESPPRIRPVRGSLYQSVTEKLLAKNQRSLRDDEVRVCIIDPIGYPALATVFTEESIDVIDDSAWFLYFYQTNHFEDVVVFSFEERLLIPGALAVVDGFVNHRGISGTEWQFIFLDMPIIGWCYIGGRSPVH